MVDFAEIREKIVGENKEISFEDFINYLKNKKIEFIVKEIKATKNVGYIYLHKKYKNKRVILIIENAN